MTVRASVPIHRGEQIFASYALSLEGTTICILLKRKLFDICDLGTKERRALLRTSKLFECDCSRCSDPTEMMTFMSALRCQKCPTGIVLPWRPLEEKETEWRCNNCPYKLTAAVVTRVVEKLKEEFEAIGPNEVDKYKYICKSNHISSG